MYSPHRILNHVAAVAVLISGVMGGPVTAESYDPTKPMYGIKKPAPLATKPDALKLTSILTAFDRRIAVINGQPRTIGDKVVKSTVERINANSVLMRKGRLKYTLKLESGGIRKQPKLVTGVD